MGPEKRYIYIHIRVPCFSRNRNEKFPGFPRDFLRYCRQPPEAGHKNGAAELPSVINYALEDYSRLISRAPRWYRGLQLYIAYMYKQITRAYKRNVRIEETICRACKPFACVTKTDDFAIANVKDRSPKVDRTLSERSTSYRFVTSPWILYPICHTRKSSHDLTQPRASMVYPCIRALATASIRICRLYDVFLSQRKIRSNRRYIHAARMHACTHVRTLFALFSFFSSSLSDLIPATPAYSRS